MPPDSGAVRLAEASDWVGLQRLIEKSPEVASEVGDYGMLPIHWACTESHVPLTLLTRLLAAYPQGARTKNDAELLPLHIAIRARVDAEWIEKLVDVYPQAVNVNGPDGLSVLELADQVSLSVDALKVLRKAMDSCESPADDPASLDLRPEHDSDVDDDGGGHGNDSSDWHKHTSKHHLSDATTSRVSPLTLRTSHFLTSDGVATPVSPAHSSSVRSVSSCGEPRDRQDSLSPHHHFVSPSSSSSSSASATTVPLLASPAMPTLPFHRKHSLDQHTHSAAAALAARQHQEMLMRARLGTGAHPHPGALASTRGRHHSLPVVPSFDHLRFTTPDHRRFGADSVSSVCSEDGDDDDEVGDDGDNNNVEDHRERERERGRPHRNLRRSSLLGLRASLGSRVRGKKAPTPAELVLQQHPHLHSRSRGTRSFESPPNGSATTSARSAARALACSSIDTTAATAASPSAVSTAQTRRF
ncbi:hypothetical protein PINS_up011352 [Pythium insidiosum]|nr:hypothetical protein PINS_up011352 [Pythium insidiosum]